MTTNFIKTTSNKKVLRNNKIYLFLDKDKPTIVS